MPITSEQTQEPKSDIQIEPEEPIPEPTGADTGPQVSSHGTQLNSRQYGLRENRNALIILDTSK